MTSTFAVDCAVIATAANAVDSIVIFGHVVVVGAVAVNDLLVAESLLHAMIDVSDAVVAALFDVSVFDAKLILTLLVLDVDTVINSVGIAVSVDVVTDAVIFCSFRGVVTFPVLIAFALTDFVGVLERLFELDFVTGCAFVTTGGFVFSRFVIVIINWELVMVSVFIAGCLVVTGVNKISSGVIPGDVLAVSSLIVVVGVRLVNNFSKIEIDVPVTLATNITVGVSSFDINVTDGIVDIGDIVDIVYVGALGDLVANDGAAVLSVIIGEDDFLVSFFRDFVSFVTFIVSSFSDFVRVLVLKGILMAKIGFAVVITNVFNE